MTAPACAKPMLVVFARTTEGTSRRLEAYLAQVLQRRRNHDSFRLRYVASDEHPELVERFRVDLTPTLLVVEGRRVSGRLVQPKGVGQIESFLRPWLR